MLSKLWQSFREPSPRNPDPHHRGATGVWHAALGAIPGLIIADYGKWPMVAAIAVVVGIYLIKEWGDLRRGGRCRDSIEDALFVWMGAASAYYDAMYGLIFVNIAALFVMACQITEAENGENT